MTSADYRNEERKLTAFEAIARARALLDDPEDEAEFNAERDTP